MHKREVLYKKREEKALYDIFKVDVKNSYNF